MLQQIPGYIILAMVIAFIFQVNSINLKKNRAIHNRAVMLNKKARHAEKPEEISSGDVSAAVHTYNLSAQEFNDSISSGVGSVLNFLLRYPAFEICSEDEL